MPRGAITERHKITLQNVFIHRSWLVEWTSHPIRNTGSLTIVKRKLISSDITWLNLKIDLKKQNLCSLSLTLLSFPYLASHCPDRICSEQCLEICITTTSCVCLPLYNLSLIVFLNCKSLWIKASAKWINLNVVFSWSCDLNMAASTRRPTLCRLKHCLYVNIDGFILYYMWI